MLDITVPIEPRHVERLDELAQRWDAEPADIIKALVDASLDDLIVRENGEHVEMLMIPEHWVVINMIGQYEKIKQGRKGSCT